MTTTIIDNFGRRKKFNENEVNNKIVIIEDE